MNLKLPLKNFKVGKRSRIDQTKKLMAILYFKHSTVCLIIKLETIIVTANGREIVR